MEELLGSKAILHAQEQLDRQLKAVLPIKGSHQLGYRGGGQKLDLYSEGKDRLYYASIFIDHAGTAPRYWNAFGLYDGKPHSTQRIAVEINIPNPPSRHVAGFFARDVSSGDTLLFHDGKVGGGKKGVSRQAFLRHSGLPLVSVTSKRRDRVGVIVARLEDSGLTRDIAKFVRHVLEFKQSLDVG